MRGMNNETQINEQKGQPEELSRWIERTQKELQAHADAGGRSYITRHPFTGEKLIITIPFLHLSKEQIRAYHFPEYRL